MPSSQRGAQVLENSRKEPSNTTVALKHGWCPVYIKHQDLHFWLELKEPLQCHWLSLGQVKQS